MLALFTLRCPCDLEIRSRSPKLVQSYEITCSVTSILEHLKWKTLESRQTKSQLTMFFKINNNLVDILPDQYITAGHSRTRANHSLKFQQIPARTNCFKVSFFSHRLFQLGILCQPIALTPSLASFKGRLGSYPSRLQSLTKVG